MSSSITRLFKARLSMMMVRPRQRRAKMVPMTVCRQKRLALKMTQQKLAQLAGVPQPYVSNIELRRPFVSDYDLAAVAKALGIKDPQELMKEVVL